MTEHDCRKWSLDVAYSVSGTSIPVASGTVCQLCGKVLAGTIPPQVQPSATPEHDCYDDIIQVFCYHLSSESQSPFEAAICGVCGALLHGELPSMLRDPDPFEPYASQAWTDGDGMDDVRRVAGVWERSSDERETRP